MEVVLQWLDDLEDLVFALPLVWERMRFPFLMVGLLAAVSLHAENQWDMGAYWVSGCSVVSICIIVTWLAGLVLAHGANRQGPSKPFSP